VTYLSWGRHASVSPCLVRMYSDIPATANISINSCRTGVTGMTKTNIRVLQTDAFHTPLSLLDVTLNATVRVLEHGLRKESNVS
jgi:hypothetical protein